LTVVTGAGTTGAAVGPAPAAPAAPGTSQSKAKAVPYTAEGKGEGGGEEGDGSGISSWLSSPAVWAGVAAVAAVGVALFMRRRR
jgi:hypothetical protein